MDKNKIPRRERRHFRKYINGEIVYSEVPFGHEEKHNYSKNNLSRDGNLSVEAIKKESSVNDASIGRTLADLDGKKKPIMHDDQKIQKVLQNISDIVSPDLDSVAEAIYAQIKKDTVFNDFKKEEIEQTIKGSKHYKAIKNSDDHEIIDSDNMKLLIEDVFIQLENENVKHTPSEDNKIKSSNNSKPKPTPKQKKSKTKSSVTKKTVLKKEDKNPKSEMQDLLDDDFDFDDDESVDDLGLKF